MCFERRGKKFSMSFYMLIVSPFGCLFPNWKHSQPSCFCNPKDFSTISKPGQPIAYNLHCRQNHSWTVPHRKPWASLLLTFLEKIASFFLHLLYVFNQLAIHRKVPLSYSHYIYSSDVYEFCQCLFKNSDINVSIFYVLYLCTCWLSNKTKLTGTSGRTHLCWFSFIKACFTNLLGKDIQLMIDL